MPSVYNSKHLWRILTCKTCGEKHTVPLYCGDRFCPICSPTRLWRVRERFRRIIEKRRLRPGTSFKHLVLTVRNTEDPRDGLGCLLKGIKLFRSRKSWKRHVIGGAYVIEVTGGPGNWHIHAHFVIESYYWSVSQIKTEWESITGAWSVFIKEMAVKSIIYYLTKYLSKGTDLKTQKDDINRVLKGRRMFQPFGDWHSDAPVFIPIRYKCEVCHDSRWTCFDEDRCVKYDRAGNPVPT